MKIVKKTIARITVSLPVSLNKEVERLQDELQTSKSELFREAVEYFLYHHKRQKLRQVAEMMAEEYQTNNELTAFTDLDADPFL